MKAKPVGLFGLLVLCAPLQAQLKDSFEVVSARTSLPSPTRNSTAIAAQQAAPELLISQKRYAEAIQAYRSRISLWRNGNNQAGLEQACTGLFRAQTLSLKSKPRESDYADCPAATMARLFGRIDRAPEYITYPVFEPPQGWLNIADPGVIYRVSVRFQIDENGRAGKFTFPVSEGYYLQTPVIRALQQARFLPAIRNGIRAASTENQIDISFCLQRGVPCGSTGSS
jgi:hypothetical protein